MNHNEGDLGWRSEKIQPHHLERLAVVYLCPSINITASLRPPGVYPSSVWFGT